ncbi:Alpha/Beta hydrolase protein [Dendryphion nanum]|uniref:Alpha/Beta hydrolase protein n=1 Tax=Dendryphion nanum TaxID=256645 RepID=A0A9P9INL8_9PLEO|nr:Alpha/Beta hydrolase protein [Dendryphion nanum]
MPPPIHLNKTFTHTSPTHTTTLHHTTLGSPSLPPLILIHGTPWSSLTYHSLALSLSTHFHTHLFDNPGFGTSPLSTPLPSFSPTTPIEAHDSDLARQSAVYAALFKEWESDPSHGWNGRKPHIVAHDHGGLMALRALLLHDCAYASLCLIDVVALGPFGQPLFKSVAENPDAFINLPDLAFDGILESYIRNAAFKPLEPGLLGELMEPWQREGGKEGFVRQLCQANYRSTEEVEGRYGEVGEKIPVKILWGREDRWIGVETAERLGKALGAREVVILEEAGHLAMYDQPARVGVELGTWLVRVEAGLV